jgi:hypothetical protein
MQQFSLAFRSPEAAERAETALKADGFITESEPGHDGSYWTVSVVSNEPSVDTESVERRMKVLADTLDGDYLGHGGLTSR